MNKKIKSVVITGTCPEGPRELMKCIDCLFWGGEKCNLNFKYWGKKIEVRIKIVDR